MSFLKRLVCIAFAITTLCDFCLASSYEPKELVTIKGQEFLSIEFKEEVLYFPIINWNILISKDLIVCSKSELAEEAKFFRSIPSDKKFNLDGSKKKIASAYRSCSKKRYFFDFQKYGQFTKHLRNEKKHTVGKGFAKTLHEAITNLLKVPVYIVAATNSPNKIYLRDNKQTK